MNSAISTTNRLLVIGAVHLDDIARPDYPLVPLASNPVTWTQHIGGVAANAACAAARTLGASVNTRIEIMAAVGVDAAAAQLKHTLNSAGVATQLVEFPGASTGRYTAVLTHDGELHIGLADVSLAECLGESEGHKITALHSTQAVLVDANLSENYLTSIAKQLSEQNLSLSAMSVSPAKTLRLLPIAAQIDVLFCNRREALSMNPQLADTATLTDLADGLCQRGFTQLVLSDGSSPLLVQDKQLRVHLDVPSVELTQNVNGAGDALAGATFAARANGLDLAQAVREAGLKQAAMIVRGGYKAPKISAAVSQ